MTETAGSPKSKMCGKMNENVSHIVSECNEPAQNEYKKLRYNKDAALLHWKRSKRMDPRRMKNIINMSLKRK